MMTTLGYVLAIGLVLVGMAGAVLPAVPGLPLVFAGLLLAAWLDQFAHVGLWSLVGIAALALGGMAIDMAASWLGAKWSGASKAGLWGAIIGSICGLPLGLVGLVLGPFVGAVVGELLANQGVWRAGKIGLATLLGLAIGTAGKLGAVLAMLAVFALAWWY